MSELPLGEYCFYSLELETVAGLPADAAVVYVWNVDSPSAAILWKDAGLNEPIVQPIEVKDGRIEFWSHTRPYRLDIRGENVTDTEVTIDPHDLYGWCDGCEQVKDKKEFADYLCNKCRYGS